MKVKELIKQLQEIPEDTEVWVSRDEEGNGFNPLGGVDFAKVWFTDNWEFQFTIEDELDEYPEDELRDIVVLWP